jgi:hypothetical protein
MEAACFPETLVHTHKATLCHNLEDHDEANDYCRHKWGALKTFISDQLLTDTAVTSEG